jgi:hypothetical protein
MRRLILGTGVLALGACGGAGGYEKAMSVSERLAREIAEIAMGAATAVAFSTFI